MKSFKSSAVSAVATISTLMALALTTPAQACPLCGGIKLNGVQFNGTRLNDFKLNSVQFNGASNTAFIQVLAVTLPAASLAK